jgi:hypothetical protein
LVSTLTIDKRKEKKEMNLRQDINESDGPPDKKEEHKTSIVECPDFA